MFQEERSGSMEESLSARLGVDGRSGGTVFRQYTLSSAQYWFSRASEIFQDWWAGVTHGAKYGGSFSEMMGPEGYQTNHS